MSEGHKNSPVRVRFAPSPTGHLHLGSVRSAIFNWLFARHNQGTYLIRIEDTDYERSKQEYTDSIIRSLEWLSITSDEPIVIQSSRIQEHKAAAYDLLKENKAYRCICSPDAAEKKIAELEEGVASRYSGSCRDKMYSEQDVAGKPYAIRFKIPSHIYEVSFNDLIRGSITFAREQLDDFIIVRRDGTPTYNFVVVIDDIFMNISHIIRGEDHISNTPKQVLLYEAFSKKTPLFGHVPLILGPSGNRLSKRDAAVSLEEYRSMGIISGALFNYLVRLGWSHGDQEVFSKEELISFFSLEKIGKKGSIFDLKKLYWLNGIYLRNFSPSQVLSSLAECDMAQKHELESLWNASALESLIALYKDRATTLVDMARDIKNLAHDVEKIDLTLIAKWFSPSTVPMLEEFSERLEKSSDVTHEELLGYGNEIAAKYSSKLVCLAQALRLAITGTVMSPGIFELIVLLGIARSKMRIENLIAHIKAAK